MSFGNLYKSQVFRLTLFIIFLTHFSSVHASKDIDSLLSLSLEELTLLKVEIASSHTDLADERHPASITVISEQDIRLTPARNIYDLLEVYVPGAYYTQHGEDPHPGIRGIIADRNYNLLLLLNGRNINQKAHNGAFTELDLWELSDIKRIEIIRGPGSVIHGPGAMAGVINIVTHDADTSNGSRAGIQYKNEYDAAGFFVSHGGSLSNTNPNNQFYVFTSAHRVYDGVRQTTFYVDQYNPNTAHHYKDFDNLPQIKLHAEFNLADRWKVWTRYTQTERLKGQPHFQDPVEDDHFKKRQFMLNIEHKKILSDDLKLESILGYETLDTEDQTRSITENAKDTVNLRANFQEEELFIRSLVNWRYTDNVTTAFGGEFVYDRLGPGWGDDRDEMRLGDGRNIISDTDSIYYNNGVTPENALFAGGGFAFHTLSLFGEITCEPYDNHSFNLSARMDKANEAYTVWSPRFAWIQQFNGRRFLKTILQRSVRYNTLEQLWAQKRNRGTSDDPSFINSLELIYDDREMSNRRFTTAFFYNKAEVVGFSNIEDESRNIGDLTLAGIDIEYAIDWERVKLGVNHGYVRLIDWELDSNQPKSGVSYSDYNQEVNGILYEGRGNHLNNWPHNTTKMYLRWALKDRWIVHFDARYFWDFNGTLDGIDETVHATQGTEFADETQQVSDSIDNEDGFQAELRTNASITYQFGTNRWVQLHVQNLFDTNDNKRYRHDTGNDAIPYRRARWVEEARYVGVRAEWSL